MTITAAPEPIKYTHLATMQLRFSEISLIQLTDRYGDDEIDVAVLGQAIADASTAIDGKLAARYSVPFTTPPALIELLASDMAFYRLHSTPPKEVQERYDNALRLLDYLADGTITLGMEQPPAVPDVQFSNGRDRVFGRGMGGI